jgi:hypothetical protein
MSTGGWIVQSQRQTVCAPIKGNKANDGDDDDDDNDEESTVISSTTSRIVVSAEHILLIVYQLFLLSFDKELSVSMSSRDI